VGSKQLRGRREKKTAMIAKQKRAESAANKGIQSEVFRKKKPSIRDIQ